MQKTPVGNREHIVFYGKRNVGKSSLVNRIVGQEISLVSDIKGTTTDPVSKAMELIPFGPVVLIDTGGIDDVGELGKMRVEKTMKTLNKTDLAIYVLEEEDEFLDGMIEEFKNRNIPYLIVRNKSDLESDLKLSYDYVSTSIKDYESIENLKKEIIKKLEENKVREDTLIGDLIPYDGRIVLVIDNDSAAPKGRLILPQVQVLRDALDNGIKSYVLRLSELRSGIKDIEKVDLVITDSKVFKEVDEILPREVKMTSFSIIMARNKGDLETFVEGIRALEELKYKDNASVLISESCTHAVTHEDIGQVKIPNLLRKYLNEDVHIEFKSGEDFQLDKDYDLVIHCGSCMLNKKTMETRIRLCKEKGVPITNYGIFLSYMMGILDRSVEIFGL